MIGLENCLEMKKIINLTLGGCGVLMGELKIKQRADKWKKVLNSGMAHLTSLLELCGCSG